MANFLLTLLPIFRSAYDLSGTLSLGFLFGILALHWLLLQCSVKNRELVLQRIMLVTNLAPGLRLKIRRMHQRKNMLLRENNSSFFALR